MATIEIRKEQYDGMLSTIENLGKACTSYEKEIKRLKREKEELKDNLEIARTANWYDRVFGWKQILKLTTNNDEV